MDEEEFDIEDLLYYKRLDAKAKLEYLETLLMFLQKITPDAAKKLNEQLKREGY